LRENKTGLLNQSNNKGTKTNSISKNIHAMKELQIRKDVTPPKSGNGSNDNRNNQGNPNIILNHNAIPCYNNINIYASNMNNFKASELNLRHYIFNKMNSKKTNNANKQMDKSARSNSYVSHN